MEYHLHSFEVLKVINASYKIVAAEEFNSEQKDLLRILLRETWTATYLHRFPKAEFDDLISTLDLPNLDTMFSGDNIKIASANVDNKIVGSAIFKEVGTVAYLWGMYILPIYQRHKIGSELFRSVIKSVQDAKFIQIYVLEESHGALLFYETLGFQRLSTDTISLSPKLSLSALVMRGDVKMMQERLCLS